MKKHTILSALFGTAFCLLFTVASAVAQPGGGGPMPGNPNNPTPVPIDGGASLLVAAGAAYGLKRLRNRRAKA